MAKDLASSAIVQEVLTTYNYVKWSAFMKTYLSGQDLWDIIDNESKPDKNEAAFMTWTKKDAMALHAIQISCGPELLPHILELTSAREAWYFLKKKHEEENVTLKRALVRIQKPWQGTELTDDYGQYSPLTVALSSGDWDEVKKFLDERKDLNVGTTTIAGDGTTILHFAVCTGHVNVVEELLQRMSKEDMELIDTEGNTALASVAYYGTTRIAECLVRKNSSLVSKTDKYGMIPIIVASARGHRDLVRYLYYATLNEYPEALTDSTAGATFICNCIVNNMFEFALDLMWRHRGLAVAPSSEGVSPVFTLSQMTSAFRSTHLAFWQRWIYKRIPEKLVLPPSDSVRIDVPEQDEDQPGRGNSDSVRTDVPGINQIYDTKLINSQALELLRLISEEIGISDHERLKRASVYKAIFQAVKHGSIEFLEQILEDRWDLLMSTDMNGRDMFMCAIAHRQEKIFRSIYKFRPTMLDVVTYATDRFENNMLHLAGMLPPPGRLDHISGAALQMQRELQWFKVVESIIHPKFREDLNIDGKTPRELFTEQHMDLMKEGERWMKDTATSSTVVAALIVTITFTAAFTVPGGNEQGTGFPMFIKEPLFKVFIVSDAISFFASSSSLLLFLEILTTRYGEEYFLKSLPRKMLLGLTTFVFSIATMMVAFCCSLSLVLRGRSWWVFISVFLLACLPVSLFLFFKVPLLVEIFISTYRPSIYKKKYIGDKASSKRKKPLFPMNFNKLCDACPLIRKYWKRLMNIRRPK